jgi:hypothetical protein
MPILFIATGPELTLLARRTEWRAGRKLASLSPQVEISPFPQCGATFLRDCSSSSDTRQEITARFPKRTDDAAD